MKKKYLFIILILIYSFGNSYAKNILLPPSATISGNATVCQNSTSPVITFTGSGGTAPYTFTYHINNGSPQTITTTGTNSVVTLPVNTSNFGTFIYHLDSVHDSTQPTVEEVSSGTATIEIVGVGITNPSTLNACLTNSSQTSAQVGVVLTTSSNTSLIQSITINWGDGSPIQTIPSSNWNGSVFYTYPIGSYSVTITAVTTLGCSVVRNYSAFIGSSPQAATLSLFANQATGCMPHSTQFTFGIPISNSDGTNYQICFGDSTACINYVHGTSIPSNWVFSGSTAQFDYYTISHVYNTSSCNNVVNLNGVTYNNVFLPSVITTNPCTAPQPQAGSLISVGIAPTASFSPEPLPNACLNNAFQLINTSNFGSTIDPITYSCTSTSPFYWTVTPSTAGLWTATGLGSNGGSPNNELFWTIGSMTPSIIFNQPGSYTITLFVKNSCGLSSISKTICVEPPLTPQFTLNTTSGCTPLSVTATNNTVLTNQCSTPTYLWTVTYAAGFCGTSITPIPNQTTANANYNFTEPGTYTITLATTNSCGTTTTSQTVTVKKPPTVSIAPISNTCGTANITPTATVNSCAPTGSTLNYAWSFPGGTPASANTANPGTINYASTGNYTVSLVVTNECGASTTATQTFSVNTAPVITNTNLSETICSGATTTPVNLTANPAGTTFSWSATATAGITGFTTTGNSNTIPAQTISTTNSSAGTVTYVITPTFNGCVGTAVNYVITVNPAPNITTQPVSSSVCLGGSPTMLSVAINSSSGSPSYQWYSNTSNSTTGGTLINGETNSTYNPPATTVGTFYYYCVITLTFGGCSNLTSNVATVTVNPLPTINTQPTPTQSLCVGVSIATPLTTGYTGGIGTASYQWYSSSTNSTTGGNLITGATNSTYTPPVFTTPGTYYYYAIITLSGNGCGTVTTNSAEIVVYNDPSITTQPLVTQTLCQGATPTTLEVVAIGGNGSFNYQWYSNINNNTTGGTLIPSATNATYVPPTSSVGTLYYYCIISQNTLGCSVTSTTAAVIINQSPSVVNQPISSSVCVGGTPSTLSFTYSNGAGTPTYQWYSNTTNDITSGTPISGETNATFTPPANSVGTMYYYCLVTFPNITGSCATIATNTAEIIITSSSIIDQNPLPNQSLCIGATISNPLNVTYTGGTGTPSYQWYSNTTNSSLGGALISGATSQTYTPPVYTTAGNFYYYVEITFSGSGCGSIVSDAATVNVVTDPVINSQPLNAQTVCQNASATTISVTASGGIGSSYTYQWYQSTTNNINAGVIIPGETNDTFTPPTATIGTMYYYCVINQSNSNGCDATSNIAEVIVNPAPIISSQPQSDTWCKDEIPTALSLNYSNGTGVPTYQWYSNTTNSNTGGFSISGATNATFTPPTNAVGSLYYYCIINFPSLTGGCEIVVSDTALITVNQNPVVNSESVTICSNNPFNIAPSNGGGNIIPLGTTYTWSTPTINPIGAITGATAETVQQSQISQTLINTTTSPATVTYTVTPISGVCVGNDFTVTVVVNPAISPNVTVNNNTCFGVDNASISTNIIGGIPPYSITWLGPNGYTSAATTISNIEPGIYDLTINDTGNCPYTNTYTITEPDDIMITIDSENDITCYGYANGSINISISGGTGNYSYTWTKDTAPFSNDEDITNLSPGTYVVTVTDANNCGPKIESFTITQPPLLSVSLISQTNIECYGAATGAININPNGGTPIEVTPGVFEYNYAWTGPNGFTSSNQNLANIFAGTYDLTITDQLGCTDTLSVTITQSTEIIISYTTTPITCYGANDASFSTTISGGNPPYQYQWSNLSTALNQNNLSAGTYTITVTDNLGCVKSESIIIPEAPIFTVNPIVNNISCYGANDGSINLNLTGGIPVVTLTWSDGSTAGLIRNNLPPGTYTATISDGTPCYIVRTFTIVEPQPLVISANITNPLDCSNPNSGAIDLIVAGGTTPFNYSWSNGATTEDLNNVNAGNYQVTVTDANGCTLSNQFSLVRPAPIAINVTTQTDFNCATHQVTQNFVAQASGGVPPFQYQWSSGNISGPNNNIMNSSTNGTVILTVTDSAGCTATYTVDVDNPVLGYSSFDTTSFGYTSYGIYSIGDPIQFQSNITGDYISVSWDFGDGTFSTELNPIHTYVIPKEYIVTQTVTYPFGCVYVQTISLLVEKGYLIVVPTAFTPNNDSLNDTYRPVTKRLKNVKLDIYDTWGSMIYSETGEVLVGWDGKINGFHAENGNYYAKVTAETFYGTIIFDNQTFVLIK